MYEYRPTFDLERFHIAQGREFAQALEEIQAGKKKTHWMWFVFPQLAGLGHSADALYFAIPDLAAARAYWADPCLRENLLTITRALLALETNNPVQVLDYPDSFKLCACMTLFEQAAPETPEFGAVLEKFYEGYRDPQTLRLLGL